MKPQKPNFFEKIKKPEVDLRLSGHLWFFIVVISLAPPYKAIK